MGLELRAIELAAANNFVRQHHRHHNPVVGHRFSIGAYQQDKLVGVAIVGRPVARMSGHKLDVLEVTRLCSDGTKNVCSFLYSACARAGAAMGYKKIQTYILEAELGTSLLASGWSQVAVVQGRQWKHTDNRPRRTDQPIGNKWRWEKVLSDRSDSTTESTPNSPQMPLL